MAEGGDKDITQQVKKDVGSLDDRDKHGEEQGKPKEQSTTEWLMNLMKQSLQLEGPEDRPEQLLPDLTIEGVAEYIKSNKCKNIITLAGAGISTSAGIPDFRSPGTGLYDNLQKYNLSSPQDIFDIGFFRSNPEPFFQLAKELWPGMFKPTPGHYFIKMLHDKGLLLRHFTQNIDTLERVAGLEGDKIVEAHGTFHTSHCIDSDCRKEYSQEWIKEKIFAEEIPKCTEEGCGGLVKPDIIFFGEALPYKFFKCMQEDLPKCDMLIIMGTSLVVQPFASLVHRVKDECPRLYINLEAPPGSVYARLGKTNSSDPILALLGMGHGFRFDAENNYRDVFWQGTADDGSYKLADLLGWGDELRALVKAEHERIEAEYAKTKGEEKKDAQAKEEKQDTPAKEEQEAEQKKTK